MRFLALLELCKRGWVTLDQGETFGDLVVVWVPRLVRAVHRRRWRRGRGVRRLSGPAGGALPEEYRAIEAVLLSAVEPVPPTMLAELLEMPVERVEAACAELAAGYEAEGRGFVLARVAGGYRYQTHPDLAPFVERFAMEGVSSRLSSAALETLAIVAYRQPVSRAQIAALRGVNVDGVVRLLEQRGYIAAVGHAAGPGPARPLRHHAGLLGEARPGSPRRAAPRRGPPARARGRRAARGAPAPGRRCLTGRRHRPDTRPADDADLPRASACRRCWPGWGSAAGGPARS